MGCVPSKLNRAIAEGNLEEMAYEIQTKSNDSNGQTRPLDLWRPLFEGCGYCNGEFKRLLSKFSASTRKTGIDEIPSKFRVRISQLQVLGMKFYEMEGRDEVAAFLLSSGADPNRGPVNRGEISIVPIHLTTIYSRHSIMERLLLYGANPNIPTKLCKDSPLLTGSPDNYFTSLHLASAIGDILAAHILIKSGAAIDAPTMQGKTALFIATMHMHYDIIRLLLEHGSNPNILPPNETFVLQDAKGNFSSLGLGCLHIAAARLNDAQDVALLLKHGAVVDLHTDILPAPLFIAVLRGNKIKALMLLEAGADPNLQGLNGLTPLLWLISHGRTDLVEELINGGADVDAMNGNGQSCLIVASYNGMVNCVELLLEKGANVDTIDSDGGTALTAAIKSGHTDVGSLLLRHNANPNIGGLDGLKPLLWLISHGRTDLVEELINGGADIEAFNSNRESCLIVASYKGMLGCVELLLKKGANVDTLDSDGDTALTAAIKSGYPETASLLLNYNANPSIHRSACSPLLRCCRNGYSNLLRQLIQAGVSLDDVDVSQSDAVIGASAAGQLECLQILLENGAKTNTINSNGDTALMLAIHNGYVKTATMLLNCDKDLAINAVSSAGVSALWLAQHKGFTAIANKIISLGGDPRLGYSEFSGDRSMQKAQPRSTDIAAKVLRAGGTIALSILSNL